MIRNCLPLVRFLILAKIKDQTQDFLANNLMMPADPVEKILMNGSSMVDDQMAVSPSGDWKKQRPKRGQYRYSFKMFLNVLEFEHDSSTAVTSICAERSLTTRPLSNPFTVLVQSNKLSRGSFISLSFNSI